MIKFPGLGSHYVLMDEEDGGGGSSGGGGGDTPITFENQAKFDAAIAEAVTKAVTTANDASKAEFDEKRQTLLNETKAAKEAAKKWESLDFDQVSAVMKVYGESEDAKLIAEGKIDEVITKKIDTEKAKWEEERTTTATALETMTTERDTYKGLYETKLTDIQIRAAAEKANVIPSAIDDIVARGLQIFSVDKDGNLEARDSKGELMKTDSELLLTPELFLEGLKDTAAHYWPPGEGTGGSGDKNADGSVNKGSLQERKAAAAKRGDMKEFHRLDAVLKEERGKGNRSAA